MTIGPDMNIPGLAGLAASFPLLSFVGDALDGAGNRSAAAMAGPAILAQLDPPTILNLTYPPDGMIIGISTDKQILHIEGNASDYLPQFVRVVAQADPPSSRLPPPLYELRRTKRRAGKAERNRARISGHGIGPNGTIVWRE